MFRLAAAAVALLLLALAPARAEPPPRERVGTVEPPVVDTKPLVFVLGYGLGAPTGLMGGWIGYTVAPGIAVELGGGMGFTGVQLAAMGRYHIPFGPRASLVAGFGPSMALLSREYGFFVPHRDDVEVEDSDVFTAAWLDAELGYEYRAYVGFTWRAALGFAVRVHDGMSHLCDGVERGETEIPHDGCDPPHFAPGPVFAEAPLLPYVSVAAGWAF